MLPFFFLRSCKVPSRVLLSNAKTINHLRYLSSYCKSLKSQGSTSKLRQLSHNFCGLSSNFLSKKTLQSSYRSFCQQSSKQKSERDILTNVDSIMKTGDW